MQTFLPLPSFKGSAKCLDNKRLGKQRVECKQILLCCGVNIGEHKPGKKGWRNHPAVLMWAGHEIALLVYAIVVCREWTSRGFQDRLEHEFETAYTRLRPQIDVNRYPTWFGLPALHASHRSSLLRKDLRHYSRFGWDDPIYLPYFWPVQTGQESHEKVQKAIS